jgi:uncharacterized protein YdeI (YjbR/CyaY-like superfamily)
MAAIPSDATRLRVERLCNAILPGQGIRQAVTAGSRPPLLAPRDRAELRAWLEVNHAASPPVRLVIGKKGNSVTRLSYDDAVEEALAFGWIDSTAHRLDADRMAVTFTRRKPGSAWSRSNKERVERLIAEGRMAPAGLAAIEAAKANGSWSSLDDAEALVVPEDLAAALAAEPAARLSWETVSASQRKMSLYWIASAKRPETRSRRVSEIVRAAAEGRRLW